MDLSKLSVSALLIVSLCIGCKSTNSREANYQNNTKEFVIEEGDILFQKWWQSDFAKAINAVTEGYGGHDFAHVGLVVSDGDTLKVLESTSERGTILSDLESFVHASTDSVGTPQIAVARLKEDYKPYLKDIVSWSKDHIGSGYDSLFIYGNDTYYCAELLHDAFNKTIPGGDVFRLAPMTYIDPSTNEVFPVWTQYFDRLNSPIPEGAPGINPGAMSRSNKLEIVYEYWRK